MHLKDNVIRFPAGREFTHLREPNATERLERIRKTLERINYLMHELNKSAEESK
jgi:hypothetical protein